ncbi:hypothetical protein R1sor_000979 [Riccia sorocarpa]|uniref:Reverse transcriptase zinc-binding domain-containing protein n=1 Tax=Riccia sorocarpa TaxID=122646 RepID=A0ABD3GXT8_9MARC
MRTPHRRYALKRFLIKERPHFVAVQETHLEAERLKFFVSTLTSDYEVIASSSEGRMKGVALLYSKNVELLESREGLQGRLGEEEMLEFTALCSTLGVRDARESVEKREGPRFTRAQTSDHIPVMLRASVGTVRQKRPIFRGSPYFKADHYVVQQNLEHLKEVWEELQAKEESGTALEHFSRCWVGFKREIKALQYQKKAQLSTVPEKERRIQELLNTDVDLLSAQQVEELATLTEQVRELQAWDHHRWRLTLREKFLKEGDACTQYFFRRFKGRRKHTFIKSLKTAKAEVLEDEERIKHEVYNSYSNLYNPVQEPPTDGELRAELLSDVSSVLSGEQNAVLEEIPSDREIFESLMMLPAGKSPGVDCMTQEEKAYDRLCPQYLWDVMANLGFSEKFIRVVQALQTDAESRVLLNGSLLPTFQVDESSVKNLFQVLRIIEAASGGKINVGKSKVLKIGASSQSLTPFWLSELGIQVIDPQTPTRYLGAQLTTLWRGADNALDLIHTLHRKAKNSTSSLLPFESRVLFIRHALFPILIYQMSTSRFKRSAWTNFERVLREFLWSVRADGTGKKLLAAWDSIRLPVSLGGLGIFGAHDFQQGLICTMLLRAFDDPDNLWVPVLATAFLGVSRHKLVEALCSRSIPSSFKLVPVASLLIRTWENVFSLYLLRPSSQIVFLQGDLNDIFFLQARKFVGIREASRVTERLTARCSEEGIFSPSDLRLRFASDPFSLDNCNALDEVIFLEVLTGTPQADALSFQPTDWVTTEGEPLNLKMRAAETYNKIIKGRALAHHVKLNGLWHLNFDLGWWQKLWNIASMKRLGQRHKVFAWRVMHCAFFDGKRAQKMRIQNTHCHFCRADVEDFSHAVWGCPRWDTFWEEFARRFKDRQHIISLRYQRRTLPEVLCWSQDCSGALRLFRTWLILLTWRTLWTERCTFVFQNKLNTVSLVRIARTFLEELWARRSQMKKQHTRSIAASLLEVLPLVAPRYLQLLGREDDGPDSDVRD